MNEIAAGQNRSYVTSEELAAKLGKSEATVKKLVREFDIPYQPAPKTTSLRKAGSDAATKKVAVRHYWLPLNAEVLLMDALMVPASVRRERAVARKMRAAATRTRNQLSLAAKARAVQKKK